VCKYCKIKKQNKCPKKQDVTELLQFINLSEEARSFYNEALENTTEDPEARDHTEVQYDEEEPFI